MKSLDFGITTWPVCFFFEEQRLLLFVKMVKVLNGVGHEGPHRGAVVTGKRRTRVAPEPEWTRS